jgi:hypothetical protein
VLVERELQRARRRAPRRRVAPEDSAPARVIPAVPVPPGDPLGESAWPRRAKVHSPFTCRLIAEISPTHRRRSACSIAMISWCGQWKW